MRGLAVAAAAIVAAAAAQSVPAQESFVGDTQYRTCMREAGNDAAIRGCGDEWLARLDYQLNVEWRGILPMIDGPRRTALVEEQRAWIRFRDLSCAYLTDFYGTNGPNIRFPQCRAEIVAARTAELRELRNFLIENH